MKARDSSFITSAAKPSGFAAPDLPEIAFAGRSNVGKSSLINSLVGVTRLAHTSNTPGRTRLINWFHIEPPKGPPLVFVDLPGYGYAKVSRSMREGWRPLIESYLSDRSVLRAVVVLVDCRRGAQEEELDLISWLGEAEVPVIVVLTKVDKLPKAKRKPAALALKRKLGLSRSPLTFSSLMSDGIDDLWRAIARAVK